MVKKYLLSLAIGLFIVGGVTAQPNMLSRSSTSLEHIIPPAPTTAALGSFGNIPADLNTGVSNVSVPLITIKGLQLSLPISLGYRTGGIRVDEMASWVGLGWSLSAGGTITRTVRGIPDETADGMHSGFHSQIARNATALLYAKRDSSCNVQYGDNALREACEKALSGKIDVEPDVYSYSFAGNSGTIYFTQAGEPIMVPRREWKITRPQGPNGFSIVTEDGTGYSFTQEERTFTDIDAGTNAQVGLVSAWHLTAITAADHHDQIEITYSGGTDAATFRTRRNQLERVGLPLPGWQYMDPPNGCGWSPPDENRSSHFILDGATASGFEYNLYTQLLQGVSLPNRIESATTEVTFITSSRQDISSEDAIVPKLDSLIWLDKLTGAKKKFWFEYDYFNSASTDPKAKRLRLLRVREVGQPPYEFYYDPRNLPARNSFSRDHWNFYNGRPNTSLMPCLSRRTMPIYSAPSNVQAKRDARAGYTQASILKQVVYPTGGRTRFSYEQNSVPANQDDDFFGEPAGGAETFSVNSNQPEPALTDTIWAALRQKYPQTVGGSGHQQERPASTTNTDSTSTSQNVTASPVVIRSILIDLPYGATMARMTTSIRRLTHDTQTSSGSLAMPYGGYLIRLCPQEGVNNLEQQVMYQADQHACALNTQIPSVCRMAGNTQVLTATLHYDFNDPNSRYDFDCNGVLTHPSRNNIAPGQYVLYCISNNNAPVEAEFSCLPNYAPPRNRLVGGVRIKQVVDEPLVGPALTTTYNYNEPAASGDSLSSMSSGVLFYQPRYDKYTRCGHLILTAYHSLTAGYLYDGYHIGYRHVTETRSGGENGRTVREYLNKDALKNNPQAHSLLVKETHYDNQGRWVRRVSNRYAPPQDSALHAFGYKVELFESHPVADGIRWPYFCFPRYAISSPFSAITTTTEELVQPNSTTVPSVSTTRYEYGRIGTGAHHTQPTAVRKSTSVAGDTLITRYRYTSDYQPGAGTQPQVAGIRQLLAANMVAVPIEELSAVQRNGTEKLVGGQLHEYIGLKRWRTQSLNLAAPLDQSSFTASAVVGNALQKDTRYQPDWVYDRYTQAGNLRQRHRPGQVPESFIWGYYETEPIAAIQNATYQQVAYTSFESGSSGGWQYDSTSGGTLQRGGHTGQRSLLLSNSREVSHDSLPAGKYELSFWTDSPQPAQVEGFASGTLAVVRSLPNGWKQYRGVFQLNATLGTIRVKPPTGTTVHLDELRLHPVGAQMSTYTYSPLVGMTSQTDPTGRTTTYEYDGIGRLLRTRDEQGRIRMQNEYHYARP